MKAVEPVAVLYSDAGCESKEAEAVLNAAHVKFQLLLIQDCKGEEVRAPRLLSVQGFFDTLEDIRLYAQLYGGMSKADERPQAFAASSS